MREAGNDVGVVLPCPMPCSRQEVIGALPALGRSFTPLLSAIDRWKPDVIHVQFAVAAFGARTPALLHLIRAIRRQLRIPVVVTLHEVSRELPDLGRLGRLTHRRIAAYSDHLIVHTIGAFDALVQQVGVSPAKVSVLPYPMAPRRPMTTEAAELRARFGLADATVLLAFGFIHVDKGFDDLVEALQIVRRLHPGKLRHVQVVLAGSVRPRHGAFRAFEIRDKIYFRRLVRTIGRGDLAQVVRLTGYVPDGEVASWFNLAEGVVLPYRRIDQSSVASLAQSFGVPVLASTAGGLAEQFAGSRWAFPPRSPARLAETILDFLAATPVDRKHDAGPEISLSFEPSTLAAVRIYDSFGKDNPAPPISGLSSRAEIS
jgi:glycosyltransferase involved in cell wall biosynthesis